MCSYNKKNPIRGMEVCECCVLSGRGLCDGLITRPGESSQLWRVVVWNQETSKTRSLKPATGLWKYNHNGFNARKTNNKHIYLYMTDRKTWFFHSDLRNAFKFYATVHFWGLRKCEFSSKHVNFSHIYLVNVYILLVILASFLPVVLKPGVT
jgi:hypothetical protein